MGRPCYISTGVLQSCFIHLSKWITNQEVILGSFVNPRRLYSYFLLLAQCKNLLNLKHCFCTPYCSLHIYMHEHVLKAILFFFFFLLFMLALVFDICFFLHKLCDFFHVLLLLHGNFPPGINKVCFYKGCTMTQKSSNRMMPQLVSPKFLSV